MNPIPQPDMARSTQKPASAPDEETIYLRPCGGGWSVHLDEDLLLFTLEEGEAFQRACEAAVIDHRSSRRMLLLSGPVAAMHAWVPDPKKARVAGE